MEREMKPRLLDLFCGAGGAARGYQWAGFHVTGVDICPQPRYAGDPFVQADAFTFLARSAHEFDVIHASPECQGYSVTAGMSWANGAEKYIPELRAALERTGKTWVIENVPGAEPHMPAAITLCGLSFGLKLFRHRLFESNVLLFAPFHFPHKGKQVGQAGFVCMSGHGDSGKGRIPANHRSVASWRAASGIGWMIREELTQAIPPAYTHWIGRQLIRTVDHETNSQV
jgi:hypothetical protein